MEVILGKSATITVNQSEQTERLVGIPETAVTLGVSEWTVRWWIQQGKITSNKLFGRRLVPESEIKRLITESRVPARAEAT